LLRNLGENNEMVAAMVGALKDAVGCEGSIEAPITAHPQFERLEASGAASNPTIARVATLLKATARGTTKITGAER
jgi:hypothetical protein